MSNGGDHHASQKRNLEQQLQPDAAPSTSARSQAAIAISEETIERIVDRAQVLFPAGLGQIVAGDDPEPRPERLKQDRHQVAHQQDPDAAHSRNGRRRQIGRPVSGVHVADADQIRRTPQRRTCAARGRVGRCETEAWTSGREGRGRGPTIPTLL